MLANILQGTGQPQPLWSKALDNWATMEKLHRRSTQRKPVEETEDEVREEAEAKAPQTLEITVRALDLTLQQL